MPVMDRNVDYHLELERLQQVVGIADDDGRRYLYSPISSLQLLRILSPLPKKHQRMLLAALEDGKHLRLPVWGVQIIEYEGEHYIRIAAGTPEDEAVGNRKDLLITCLYALSNNLPLVYKQ